MSKNIGFIGLGAMGRPMAKNLIRKGGHSLTVCDLVPAAVDELAAAGAGKAGSSAEIAERCDVIISMLPNSPDVDTAAFGAGGFLEKLRPGTIVIDMSTIDPATTRKVAQAVEGKGGRMLDAPVGRTTAHAAEGTLSIMVGGDEALFEECRPILSCMGSDLIYCGPIGSGETMKIVNNLLTGIIVAANSEALTLGTKAGLKLETMLQVLRSTSANNGHLHVTFPDQAFKGNFAPGFATRLAYKDLNIALSLAGQLESPLSLGAVAAQLFNMARSLGHGNDDYSSVIRVYERFADVETRNESR